VLVRRLWLHDVRSYETAELDLAPGTTALVGANGQGKTNLVEALAFLATLDSFRGAPTAAMVRRGASSAVIRAEVHHADGREILVEVELGADGRTRVLVNKQRLVRTRDLVGVLRVTVFSPDDLDLVKGPPASRRRFLDDLLVALAPRNDKLRADVDRVLRQRASLLRQAGGRLTEELTWTLDVFDAQLADLGTQLGAARARLVQHLEPHLAEAYDWLAGSHGALETAYVSPWQREGLAGALAAARPDDLRRQVTTVGPHRDELDVMLAEMPARTHASQGEQRSAALALRLAGHRLVTAQAGDAPLLLLDDVFSELDATRGDALVRHLPAGQVVLTTAGALPDAAHPDRVVHIEGGKVVA
jgi:DNA replication and repair protein RecF